MGANVACRWSVKSLQESANLETSASRRERGGRLDKLGVTGSSPVPPTSERPAQAGFFHGSPAGGTFGRRLWKVLGRSADTGGRIPAWLIGTDTLRASYLRRRGPARAPAR